jgi:general secretion pathway protein G
MIERLQQRRQGEGGFTLVELLVVIVILGILAAIVVFAVGGITDKGSKAANSTDISVLQAAEEAAFAQSAATPPVYLSESGLITAKFLRTLSATNDICLSNAVAAAPPVAAIPAGADYKVVAHTQDAAGVTTTVCSGAFTLAP